MTAEHIIAELTKAGINTSKHNNSLVDVVRNDYSVSHEIVKKSSVTWKVSMISPSGYSVQSKIIISIGEIVQYIKDTE